ADGGLGDGQAEAAALRAAADHRIENPVADFGGNARAVVDDVEPAHDPVVISANGEMALDPGAQADAAAAADHARAAEGLHGVAGDIEHRLDQLFPVAVNLRDAGIVIANDRQIVAGLGFEQGGDMLGDFVDIYRCQDGGLVGAEQAVYQVAVTRGRGG